MSANCAVEVLKLIISLVGLTRVWRAHGVTSNNSLRTSWEELLLYPIPAALYLAKNLLQYFVFLHVDAPSYQILKNLNIITTGVLYRIFLQRKLTGIQWAALILLAIGCTTSQLTIESDRVLSTSRVGFIACLIMAFLSGAAGVYTELIMKKKIQRDVNVQNVYLYSFGTFLNILVMLVHERVEIIHRGVFRGFQTLIVVMIFNHALSGIAVSLVMKYADNIVKVYSTSVAMLLTAVVSVPMFGFKVTVPFVLGSSIISISVYLHHQGKQETKR